VNIIEKTKNSANSNISPCQNIIIIFKKKSSKKETQKNPSRYYYNSIITNLQVSTQAKILCFKNPHIKKKIDLLYIT